jgi:hypothetical protein
MLISPQEYETLLKALKERIRSAQLQALRSVNSELIFALRRHRPDDYWTPNGPTVGPTLVYVIKNAAHGNQQESKLRTTSPA